MHMRSSSMTRSFVSLTITAGIAAGASAGAAFATPESAARQAADSRAGARLTAVENRGLSASAAEYLQGRPANYWGYPGAVNGLLDTESRKAFQRFLQERWGYVGPIDGVAGPSTREAFKRFAAPKY
ncbi:peptidoglycan-binding domain-containing protein [Kitasatospora sp. NPDC001574]